MKKNWKNKDNKGIALVEMIIASAVMLAVVIATTVSYNTYVQYALANQNRVKIGYLLEEGLEAVTFLRDKGWSAYITPLSTNTTYYLYNNDTYWSATTTAQYTDGQFLRSFTIENVNRDANNDIAVAGTNDTNTKKITATVAYFEGHATTTKSISMYMTNINNN